MKYTILIIDDELIVRNSLKRLLNHDDWIVDAVANEVEAKDFLSKKSVDLAIVDYKLGDTDGLEVLDYLRDKYPNTLAIMLTAYGNIALAVDAIKMGAYNFLQKEGDPQIMRHQVEKALERVCLRKEVERLQKQRIEQALSTPLICISSKMKKVLQDVNEFAGTNTTVMIEGETGTGKSLIAEYIHYASAHKDGLFVTINCGAIPKELIESELFGYEKGAFTGAKQQGKIGLIKRADEGTLFLDEIGDLELDLQSKLLYVLEKSEFLSVGAVEPTKVNVRFIAATNADLESKIKNQQFRQDLYYRLNVAYIKIPPIRERKEDILPLAKHFICDFNHKFSKAVTEVATEAEERMLAYSWPGNVRELRNVIERIMLLKKNHEIDASDLCFLESVEIGSSDKDLCHLEIRFNTGYNVIQEVTCQVIVEAWEISEHNQTKAAKLLSVPRTTLQNYLQKYHLI